MHISEGVLSGPVLAAGAAAAAAGIAVGIKKLEGEALVRTGVLSAAFFRRQPGPPAPGSGERPSRAFGPHGGHARLGRIPGHLCRALASGPALPVRRAHRARGQLRGHGPARRALRHRGQAVFEKDRAGFRPGRLRPAGRSPYSAAWRSSIWPWFSPAKPWLFSQAFSSGRTWRSWASRGPSPCSSWDF